MQNAVIDLIFFRFPTLLKSFNTNIILTAYALKYCNSINTKQHYLTSTRSNSLLNFKLGNMNVQNYLYHLT